MTKIVRRWLPALLLALLAATPRPTAAAEDAWEDDLAAYVAARDPVRRLAAALHLTQHGLDPSAVAAALPEAWAWDPDEARGPVEWERESRDGVPHRIFAYVPRHYAPDDAWPVLVWLHGGVGRDLDGGGEGGIRMFEDEAEAKGFLVLSPSTRNGAHWWTPNGVDLIRKSLLDLQRRWRVDPDRVWVSGMSDGGSGCFHLLAHDPYPYAAFLPFVPNPLVTRIYGGPTWDLNLQSRPVMAISGGQDRLYPAAAMKPFMDEIREAGCDLTWIEEPEAGHDLSYLPARWEQAWAFLTAHPRDPLPTRVAWTTSRPRGEGRFAWIEILALDPDAASEDGIEPPEELELPQSTPRPRLGVRLDVRYPGPGIRIEEVEEGTPAHEAGFLADDVLVAVGGTDLPPDGEAAFQRLRAYLEGLEGGEGTFAVRRGEETVELRARPRPLEVDRPERPQELGYDVKPGTVIAEVLEGNVIEVRTDGVGRLRVHLASPLVDFERDLVVRVNGTERFRGLPPQDVAWMLTQAIRLGPGAPVFRGYVDLDL